MQQHQRVVDARQRVDLRLRYAVEGAVVDHFAVVSTGLGHEEEPRGPGTRRRLDDAELQHFVDLFVDLRALGRGHLKRLNGERGVIAGVDVALDTDDAPSQVRVIENIGEFGD